MTATLQHTVITDPSSRPLREVLRLSPAPPGVRGFRPDDALGKREPRPALARELGEAPENVTRALSGEVNSIRAKSIREQVAARWGLDMADIFILPANIPPTESQTQTQNAPKTATGGILK